MKTKSGSRVQRQQLDILFSFSERRSSFSLKIRAIRPSTVFGTRRKNVLRGAGYAWALGSGVSSNSLR